VAVQPSNLELFELPITVTKLRLINGLILVANHDQKVWTSDFGSFANEGEGCSWPCKYTR
jgi:hypothetical protein